MGQGKREMLYSLGPKDFRVDTFRSGGKGGQHQNKTESGVRITHIESGAVGESREHREQSRNKRTAFERLVASPRFKAWHKRKVALLMLGKSLEEEVDRMMEPQNLRVEVQDDGRWVDAEKAE